MADDPTDGQSPSEPAGPPDPGTAAGGEFDPDAETTLEDHEGAVLVGGRIEPVVLEDEMKSSFLDYAMSVIVSRALPDVRDGLKPVHRRILYSMYESGLRPERPYRKCASAVGEVMKKYHPHGDSSIYDALVRMAQPFSIRALLVDGHGNFGSVDGDPPAAMRYTEARLSRLAMELLRDIDEDTVDFEPNFDGYEEQPTVLPARFPNLLVNGSTGIAVGMATNIPPHNLREVIDATIALIDDPTLTAVDLMEYIPAPDFPTGGLILGQAGAYEAFTTGRGSVKVRSVCTVEEDKGSERIVVTEIPYMVNKSNLLVKMADLVNNKVIEGIRDIQDHSSNRNGMQIVIELKRGANAQVVLNQLYKHTQLQDNFGVNLLAIVEGVPKTLTLDQALHHYVDHQVEVITRRTRYRLRKAEDRAHIVEGLLTALDHIDEVITIIRGSESADAAKAALQERFEFSERQAQAILDMQLRRLAALERQKLQDEYRDLMELITELRAILADPMRVRQIIKDEMLEVRDKYGDDRRSRIVADDGAMTVEDLIPQEDIVITLTRGGYIKRTAVEEFRTQKRGGRGVRSAALKEDDIVDVLLTCSTHDFLLVFTDQGRVYRIKAYQVPEQSRSAKGVYVANVPGLAFEEGEQVRSVRWLKEFDEDRYLLFVTRQGMVKRTKLDEYDSPRSVLNAIKLREDDELINVTVTEGDDEVVLVTRNGKAIRFHEDDARAMGRDTSGVIGIRLRDTEEHGEDAVVAGGTVSREWIENEDGYVLVITEEGYGKRSPISAYPQQKRGGQGVVTARLTEAKGGIAGALIVDEGDEILLVTDNGTLIRLGIDYDSMRPMSRSTQGVRVMRPDAGSKVVGVTLVVESAEEDPDAVPEDDGPAAAEPGNDASLHPGDQRAEDD